MFPWFCSTIGENPKLAETDAVQIWTGEKEGRCSCDDDVLGEHHSSLLPSSPRWVSKEEINSLWLLPSAWDSHLLWENAVSERLNHPGLPWGITEPPWEHDTTVRGDAASVTRWSREHNLLLDHHRHSLRNPYLDIWFQYISFSWFPKYLESFRNISAITKPEITGNANLSSQKFF